LGPSRISVYRRHSRVYALDDDQFTVTSEPIVLHDFEETITRDDYQTGVGADGTVYLAFDLKAMTEATTYSGMALGYPFRFEGRNVAIFNAQGFLGEVLDPDSRGLFRIKPGGPWTSSALDYWRHEFRTYKEDHRKRDARLTLVPLLLAIRSEPAGSAFCYGALLGYTSGWAVTWCFADAAARYFQLSLPLAVVGLSLWYLVVCGVPFGLFAAASAVILRSYRFRSAGVLIPALWVATEVLRGRWMG